jgi:hypothetical protein
LYSRTAAGLCYFAGILPENATVSDVQTAAAGSSSKKETSTMRFYRYGSLESLARAAF